jgi:succinate dehydrogenase/fumarate reductase flavoprotein subunit
MTSLLTVADPYKRFGGQPVNGNRTYKVSDETAQKILAELARRMKEKREAEAQKKQEQE